MNFEISKIAKDLTFKDLRGLLNLKGLSRPAQEYWAGFLNILISV
jgi:hypothetical protein